MFSGKRSLAVEALGKLDRATSPPRGNFPNFRRCAYTSMSRSEAGRFELRGFQGGHVEIATRSAPGVGWYGASQRLSLCQALRFSVAVSSRAVFGGWPVEIGLCCASSGKNKTQLQSNTEHTRTHLGLSGSATRARALQGAVR